MGSPDFKTRCLQIEERMKRDEIFGYPCSDMSGSVLDASNLNTLLEILNKDEFECIADGPLACMCKLTTNHKKRARAPVKEIINHKWHGGKLFLLCLLDSKKACPEYLRTCQVYKELRVRYCAYLKSHNGKPPRIKERWTSEDEVAVKYSLHNKLEPLQLRVQEELKECFDTVEWDKKSNNGRLAVVASAAAAATVARPGPALETDTEQFFEVERIIGASLAKGKTWFLIKWVGYEEEESSWEPPAAVQMSQDAVQHFYNTYGRPTTTNSKVLSPEGIKQEKYLASLNFGKPAKKKK